MEMGEAPQESQYGDQVLSLLPFIYMSKPDSILLRPKKSNNFWGLKHFLDVEHNFEDPHFFGSKLFGPLGVKIFKISEKNSSKAILCTRPLTI